VPCFIVSFSSQRTYNKTRRGKLIRKFSKNQAGCGEIPILGVTPIEAIQFDPSDKDDINKLLMGLQAIYCDEPLRAKILQMIASAFTVSQDKGREGMDYWSIFVIGILRFGDGLDYDRIYNLVSNHRKLRELLGFDSFLQSNETYTRSSIHRNLSILTAELVEQMDILVVQFAHQAIIKTPVVSLQCRADSFVLKSNVHFPTDFAMLFDCCNGILRVVNNRSLPGWREHQSKFKKLKKAKRSISRMRASNSQDPKKKEARAEEYKELVKGYLCLADTCLKKAALSDCDELQSFIDLGRIFTNQIKRRCLNAEKIPANEKIYSIYEEYTEWISKGKAGVSQELGVRLAVVEDQYGFICHSRVMFEEQDVDIAVELCMQIMTNYTLESISFDKGFHSKRDENGLNNTDKIEALNVVTTLPKKGRRSRADKERESAHGFVKRRKKHAGIESKIHALQNHGLDRCPDRGRDNFKRYAKLGILAMNIHSIGAIVLAREADQLAAA
jgi:hypothetical protein